MNVSSQVVEQAGVTAAFDPFVQPACQRARKQVGDREQPALSALQHIHVFDGVVDLTVLELAQAIAVLPFQQHAHERVQEMQMLRRGVERERVDRDVRLSQPDFQIASPQQGRELAVAVPEIKDDRQRVVLLGVGHEEVDQEALPAAGRAEHERVPDVLDVQVECVRRVVGRFKEGERLAPQMGASVFATFEREQETQVGGTFVSSNASRRRLCALFPGTMLSHAFSRL